MAFKIIDTILNRIFNQVDKWEEARRRTFSEFIHPVFQDFEKVHSEFSDSFERYRNVILKSSHLLNLDHQIFSEIEKDSRKTESQRIKILKLSQCMNDPIIGNFISAIKSYIEETYLSIDARMRYTNAPRSSLFEILYRLCSEIKISTLDLYLERAKKEQIVILPACDSVALLSYSSQIDVNKNEIEVEEFKKIIACATLDKINEQMQERYGRVVNEYAILKDKLYR